MKTTHNVHGIKLGNTINAFIDGVHYKKTYDSDKEALKTYKLLLEAQNNPTEDNVINLTSIFVGMKYKIAKKHGLEYNITTSEVYLDGFKTPMPDLLIKTFEDYSENGLPIDAIKNFWGLLMTNPDENVRKNLFNYIQTYNLVITKYGYFLAYKAVTYKSKETIDLDLAKYVQDKHNVVKTQWKTNPNRYVVYKSLDEKYMITKTNTFKNWNLKEKGVTEIGNLDTLFNNKNNIVKEQKISYTDIHTKTMDINVGEVVHMPRKECDNNPSNECSYGLHVGAVKYVNSFSSSNDQILMCLINPAHVVAIPNYDNSKIRVSEYYPFALAERKKDGNIDAVESPYFENDYIMYEKDQLNNMIENIKNEEKHINTKNDLETRNNEEILKILEERVVTLNK